jgi:hypothetical protein
MLRATSLDHGAAISPPHNPIISAMAVPTTLSSKGSTTAPTPPPTLARVRSSISTNRPTTWPRPLCQSSRRRSRSSQRMRRLGFLQMKTRRDPQIGRSEMIDQMRSFDQSVAPVDVADLGARLQLWLVLVESQSHRRSAASSRCWNTPFPQPQQPHRPQPGASHFHENAPYLSFSKFWATATESLHR